MNDITISKNNVCFLKFNSPGKTLPLALSSSEDGFLAILHSDSIVIGSIGFQPLNDGKEYTLTQEIVDIDLKPSQSLLKIRDFNFEQSINDNKISSSTVFKMLLSSNFNIVTKNDNKEFRRVDWGPLDTIVTRSHLAVMTEDGRIFILGQNKLTNKWEKEYDLLEYYHQYYRLNMLKHPIDDNGSVTCKDVNDYVKLTHDLTLISFSWSSIVRHSTHNQYCIIALLSESGIITFWRIINEQKTSRCEFLYQFKLQEDSCYPKLIQFCDINVDSFIITIIYSNEQIKAFVFNVECMDDSSKIKLKNVGNPINIKDHSKIIQPRKYYWSVKYLTLIIGFESELLFAKFDQNNDNQISFLVYWLELPSNESITGIVIRDYMLYITSLDGYLYGIKMDNNLDNIDLNEISFESHELKYNCEFLDLFMSPNGVHLGLLKVPQDKIMNPDTSSKACEIALVRMMPEKELLNILMDDNRQFSRKQDAVEELRHSYFNNKHLLHVALQKLVKSEAQWDSSSLHNLQLARYLCILFGYQLNVNHELVETGNRHLDYSKIRKLESIIISRNISYWLDGFSDLDTNEINKDDCIFVINLCSKMQMIESNTEIVEAIEAALNKAKSFLGSKIGMDDSEINRLETEARRLSCPVCQEIVEFNLFASKCSKNHVVSRCCKSLDLCFDNIKRCRMCGSVEKFVDNAGLSDWRLEIVGSNCPLCDGKFTKVTF